MHAHAHAHVRPDCRRSTAPMRAAGPRRAWRPPRSEAAQARGAAASRAPWPVYRVRVRDGDRVGVGVGVGGKGAVRVRVREATLSLLRFPRLELLAARLVRLRIRVWARVRDRVR